MAGDDVVKGVAEKRDRASLVERAAARFGLLDDGDAPGAATVEKIPVANEGSPAPTGLPIGDDAPLARLDAAKCESLGARVPDGTRNRTTEEFRVIKRSVLATRAALVDRDAGVSNAIMVTSALPEEGKTFTAVNLALSLSMEPDLTVLLIDADFSCRSVTGLFSLEAEKGLVEALSEPGMDLTKVCFRTDVPDLLVVPAGGSSAMSAELLGSRKMKQLIAERTRNAPDCVLVFDAPPVLATSESGVLAPHVGQVVFVVEAEQTTKGTVEEAVRSLEGCAQVGVVLNKARRGFGAAGQGDYQKTYNGD